KTQQAAPAWAIGYRPTGCLGSRHDGDRSSRCAASASTSTTVCAGTSSTSRSSTRQTEWSSSRRTTPAPAPAPDRLRVHEAPWAGPTGPLGGLVHDANVGARGLPAVGVALARLLVGDRAGDDHVVAWLPVDRR